MMLYSKVCAPIIWIRELFHWIIRFIALYVYTDLEARGSNSYTQVQVINLDVKDNHEDATLGAFLILELCNMVRTLLYT